MSCKSSFEARLKDQYRAYQLLKRKLRTSLASKIVNNLRPTDLRNIYHAIHQERPQSGTPPSVEAIPNARESFLYMALFVSIYRSASRVNINTEIDVDAVIFAWDYFCTLFPNHIRERRPYGRIRPANFDEAWIIAQGIKDGLTELRYCKTCHRNYLIIHGSKYQPICQICVTDKALLHT
ncbi:MAG: transcriptional regulator [Methylomonas sp.]|nr:transcriptional regulator [Methylomonas sp.]